MAAARAHAATGTVAVAATATATTAIAVEPCRKRRVKHEWASVWRGLNAAFVRYVLPTAGASRVIKWQGVVMGSRPHVLRQIGCYVTPRRTRPYLSVSRGMFLSLLDLLGCVKWTCAGRRPHVDVDRETIFRRGVTQRRDLQVRDSIRFSQVVLLSSQSEKDELAFQELIELENESR